MTAKFQKGDRVKTPKGEGDVLSRLCFVETGWKYLVRVIRRFMMCGILTETPLIEWWKENELEAVV